MQTRPTDPVHRDAPKYAQHFGNRDSSSFGFGFSATPAVVFPNSLVKMTPPLNLKY
jgi:hypothetical protein